MQLFFFSFVTFPANISAKIWPLHLASLELILKNEVSG